MGAVGAEGELLCTPRPAGAEDHKGIRDMVSANFEERRRTFGDIGAPTLVWTDNIL